MEAKLHKERRLLVCLTQARICECFRTTVSLLHLVIQKLTLLNIIGNLEMNRKFVLQNNCNIRGFTLCQYAELILVIRL
jgi:hypothetical protein